MADGQRGANDGDAFFQNARTLTISEVAAILDEHTISMQGMNPDYQPNMLLAKTLEYTKQFKSSENSEGLQKMRETAEEYGLTQQELAMVCNLQIINADEAKKMVPSLERFPDEELEGKLQEIDTYRAFN